MPGSCPVPETYKKKKNEYIQVVSGNSKLSDLLFGLIINLNDSNY